MFFQPVDCWFLGSALFFHTVREIFEFIIAVIFEYYYLFLLCVFWAISLLLQVMKFTRLVLSLLLILVITSSKTAKAPKIESGKLYMQVKQTPTSSAQLFQVSYDSSVKSQLKLTQSSSIEIQAKMKFGKQSFDPQYFAFRLVHPKYDKLTQPVRAVYDSESESWTCTIDLGDPHTIQPYSDVYNLEISIADPQLTPFHSTVSSVRVTFRYSIPESKIPNTNTPIQYTAPSIINTNAPEQRIDPPETFTIFLVVLMAIVSVLFYYGLFGYLGVNLRLIPTDGIGLLLNLGLIALLCVNLIFLGKFWLQWNFIKTITNFFWLTIVTALVANFGLLYLKDRK